jgi:phosphohistidine swiveling domain-containing protein
VHCAETIDADMTEPTASPQPMIIPLARAAAYGPAVVGTKAHTLGLLVAAGFPVPDGFVVTRQAQRAWDQALSQVRDAVTALRVRRLAVRSSGTDEDLADASFAGQYETVLDVDIDGMPAALRLVFDSAGSTRVSSYRAPSTAQATMAVLVQEMIAADAAGVAFTANPLTGQRDETIVTAVLGSGERLVPGEAEGDEWVVRGTGATANRSDEGAIDAAQAVAVARLARRIEELAGRPQDIEWAIACGTLYLLQARPMTALPDAVTWDPPGPGQWMRNFRLGEWLPDPMTPLFATWLLPLLEAGLQSAMRATAGAVLAFRHAAINGWYYTALPHPPGTRIIEAVVRSRGRVVPFAFNALIRVGRRPDAADRALLGDLAHQWRDERLPGYQRRVAAAGVRLDHADADELERLINDLGHAAGEQLWWLELLGGAAWKMEACLARFIDRHVADADNEGVQVLLGGLGRASTGVPAPAVQSLDWNHSTGGELATGTLAAVPPTRRHVVARREEAERACRRALADRPARRRRFDALLDVAQRYAALREDQARDLTLAWPLLRACALRLGAGLCGSGVIDQADDVFFLTRSKVRGGVDRRADHRRAEVRTRRAEWQHRRRLMAPLTVGTAPRLLPDVVASAVATVTRRMDAPPDAIIGQPASPGRATGTVRVIGDTDDFARFEPGEILVARTMAPAWTPLLTRAAAVVTDGGTLAAHASLIAREFGLPAVVATGDATSRLHDGQIVTVDGSAGVVHI